MRTRFILLLTVFAIQSGAVWANEPIAPGDALPDARRLDPEASVWVDTKAGKVYADGRVTLREGVLEMFACPKGTKEHESVVAIEGSALLVHTALLAIGAEPGKPVRFDPEYRAPSGDEIEVSIVWQSEDGAVHQARAQEWVRHIETNAAMKLPFVFAGSGFWTDPETKRQHYLANAGDMICVSNFGSAMLDVPAPSSQSNEALLFEPFTERIPPRDTPVRLQLSLANGKVSKDDQ